MHRCEKCEKDFETEQLFQQHNRNKHITSATKHELREQKKKESEKIKKSESEKFKAERRKTQIITYGGIAIGAFAVIGFIFFLGSGTTGQVTSAATSSNLQPSGHETQPASTDLIEQQDNSFDLSGIPNSFVHWHADVDVIICGKEFNLPEASQGGLIGTPYMHTHDRDVNKRSLAGSDGNGVIHSEGLIKTQPQEHTLVAFMQRINVRPFNEEGILDRKNGDKCPDGNPGTLKVFVNDQQMKSFMNYIPRNGDFIRVEFS
jgi:hypothetical protein